MVHQSKRAGGDAAELNPFAHGLVLEMFAGPLVARGLVARGRGPLGFPSGHQGAGRVCPAVRLGG